MTYQNVVAARFLSRPNRFVAHVDLDGETVFVHVRNTGRCRELLMPGARVYLEPSGNPLRKTSYSLIAVEKGDRLINMDSQAPNRVVEEALLAGWLPAGVAGPVRQIRREALFGDSRLDFRLETGAGPAFLEVKGVTLEESGAVFFPDAPTQRGVRHLRTLVQARKQGFAAGVVFVVQMRHAAVFAPNDRTHPAFGAALREAAAAGVAQGAYCCRVEPDRIELGEEVPMQLHG